MTTIDDLAAGKYLALTTFRRDGTPVATPVWLVRDGDEIKCVTRADSGKAKRLRNSPRVLVAPCDMRGRTTARPAEATAILQDAEQTQRSLAMIRAKYGFMGRVFRWLEALQSRGRDTGGDVGITIRLAQP